VFLYEEFKDQCNSILHCFLRIVEHTFLDNGGIGGYLDVLNPDLTLPNYRIGRFLFDNIFNLLMVVVLLAIIAGIIIDTFGQLREKEAMKVEDIKGRCFVCGHEKEVFDRQSESSGFHGHVKLDHYMWNYINFIAYLKFKESTEHTGIESYLWRKIGDDDVSWLPLHKALVLEDLEDEEEQEKEQLEDAKKKAVEAKKSMEVLSSTCENVNKKFSKI